MPRKLSASAPMVPPNWATLFGVVMSECVVRGRRNRAASHSFETIGDLLHRMFSCVKIKLRNKAKPCRRGGIVCTLGLLVQLENDSFARNSC